MSKAVAFVSVFNPSQRAVEYYFKKDGFPPMTVTIDNDQQKDVPAYVAASLIADFPFLEKVGKEFTQVLLEIDDENVAVTTQEIPESDKGNVDDVIASANQKKYYDDSPVETNYTCSICDKHFNTNEARKIHIGRMHK